MLRLSPFSLHLESDREEFFLGDFLSEALFDLIQQIVFLNFDFLGGTVVGTPRLITLLPQLFDIALERQLFGKIACLADLPLQLFDLVVKLLQVRFKARTLVFGPIVELVDFFVEPGCLPFGQFIEYGLAAAGDGLF